MKTMQVSGVSIAFMAFAILFSLALPLLPYFILRKKMKARFVPLLIGAATFLVAALILESFVHSLILGNKDTYGYLMKNPMLFALYGGLMAGLFEESGRFGAFKLMRKKYNTSGDALSYGLGHGGFEAVFVLGLTMVNNIVLAVIINSGSLGDFTGMLPAAQKEQILAAATGLAAVSPLDFIAGMVERAGAVAFHVGASVLVYLSATKRASFWLYPLAILLHMALDIPAGLFQAKVLGNIWLIEGIVLVFAGLVLWFALGRLKKADSALVEAL